jgi:hypothetical protein
MLAMESIQLIRNNLKKSRDLVLRRVEEMKEHCFVPPTPNGGGHTLWVLGHLAVIESQIIHSFMLGQKHPLPDWVETFDGTETSLDPAVYPPFDQVLAKCRDVRAATLVLAETFSESDLDKASALIPKGWEDTFGTFRLCLQYAADHWYMHRGTLADARRAAGIDRMWV